MNGGTVRPEPVEGQISKFTNGEWDFARAFCIAVDSVSSDEALHFDELSANGSFYLKPKHQNRDRQKVRRVLASAMKISIN